MGPAPITGSSGTSIAQPDQFNEDVSGAVQVVEPDPTNADIAYVGTVNGGVWKTSEATKIFDANASRTHWTQLTDFLPSLSIGAISLDPSDHQSLAVGTARFSSMGAAGPLGMLYVSHDGGATWPTVVTNEPLLHGRSIDTVSLYGSTLLAGTRLGDGGAGTLVLGTASGSTYTFRSMAGIGQLPPTLGPVREIVRDPAVPTRVYVAVSGNGGGIYRTTTNGNDWIRISDSDSTLALPTALQNADNVRLSLSPFGGLFALVSAHGQPVYIGSTGDQGASWVPMEVPRFPSGGTCAGTCSVNADCGSDGACTAGVCTQGACGKNVGSCGGALTCETDHPITDIRPDPNGPNPNDGVMVVTVPKPHLLSIGSCSWCNPRIRISGSPLLGADKDWIVQPYSAPNSPPSTTQFVLWDPVTFAPLTGSVVSPGGSYQVWVTTQIADSSRSALAADPTDPKFVYVGGHVSNSYIGGAFFNIILRGDTSVLARGIPSPQWAPMIGTGTAKNTSPHTESRDLAFTQDGKLLVGTDGGVYVHSNPQGTGDWFTLNGDLNTIENHDVAFDPRSNALYVGAQDNGCAQQSPQLLGQEQPWSMLTTADGGDVHAILDPAVTDPLPPAGPAALRYYSANGGITRRYFDRSGAPIGNATNLPLALNSKNLSGAQNNFALNPSDPTRLVVNIDGGQLYESFDRGNTVQSIPDSPNLSYPDIYYGHPANPDLIWVAAGNQGFYRRITAGGSLTQASFDDDAAMAVVVSPNDQNVVYGTSSEHVWLATDGASFNTNITGDLPQPIGKLSAIRYIQSPAGDRLVVAAGALEGRDGAMGVFMMSVANPGAWTRIGTNLPNAGVFDLAYDAPRDVLAAALVGRGVWTLANVKTLDQAPVSRCRDVAVTADASCHASITTATVDNGSSDPDSGPVSCSLDRNGPFSPGMAQVTLTCTDAQGAGSTCNASVTVLDRTPPVFTQVPLDIVTTKCAQPALGTPVATDACGPVSITNDAPAKFKPGTTVVHWTATDAGGNTATATQRVTLVLADDASCCPAGTNVIRGTSNNDVLNGTSGSDCILAFGGQDTVNGNGGNDYISAGEGDDLVNGGDGNDAIFGGSGQDRLYGDGGDDYVDGGNGDDSQVHGGIGNDTLRGGQGQDHLYGEDGSDRLFGEGGDDTLDGGNGNDDLVGGGLHDTCTGGAGTNTYATCESPGTNSCTDGAADGTETDLDCGGACATRCANGKHCSSGDDCQSSLCSGGSCLASTGGGSGGLVTASFTVTTDWGSGYCVALNVANNAAVGTTNWTATVSIPGATAYQTWNAAFSGTTNTVTINPSFVWNRSIDPVTIDNSVGFCANRSVPGSGTLPAVTSLTPTF